MKYQKTIFQFLLIVTLLLAVQTLEAQCPMCRISLESNMKNGGTAGAGINKGILYLLVLPYLMVGGLAYIWWKNRKMNVDTQN